ncbi:hypothetical protein Goshw_000321, partial [Gossypium schwendimanii]|nr:hypothetical protein [Gossypium schwendimanii]
MKVKEESEEVLQHEERRKPNRIFAFKNGEGEWIFEDAMLQREFCGMGSHHKNLDLYEEFVKDAPYHNICSFLVWNGSVITDIEQARRIKIILEQFYTSFGQNVFFLSGVEEELRESIGEVLGFQRVTNLGTYLGMPLFHERVMNSSLRFMVDKVCVQRSKYGIKEDVLDSIDWGHDSKDNLYAIRYCPIGKKVWSQDIKWNTSEVIKISYNWAKQYISYHKEGLAKWQQVKWAIPRTNNWVQLNFDGAIKVDYGKAASRGVLRDR